MENTYQSIGLFIDGGYYAKVNEALAAQTSLNIDIEADIVVDVVRLG